MPASWPVIVVSSPGPNKFLSEHLRWAVTVAINRELTSVSSLSQSDKSRLTISDQNRIVMSRSTVVTFALTVVALMAAGILTEQADAGTNCLRIEDARDWLWRNHGEREVWVGPKSPAKRIIVFRNPQTGSATVLRLLEDGIVCQLHEGQDI
jgi:hypothetical protein